MRKHRSRNLAAPNALLFFRLDSPALHRRQRAEFSVVFDEEGHRPRLMVPPEWTEVLFILMWRKSLVAMRCRAGAATLSSHWRRTRSLNRPAWIIFVGIRLRGSVGTSIEEMLGEGCAIELGLRHCIALPSTPCDRKVVQRWWVVTDGVTIGGIFERKTI